MNLSSLFFMIPTLIFGSISSAQVATVLAIPVAAKPLVFVSAENSRIEFVGTHSGDDPKPSLGGFKEFSGLVGVNPAAGKLESLELSFSIGSTWTEFEKQTGILLSADFFEQPKFRVANFLSTKITPSIDGQCLVKGDLTLHGTTAELLFPASMKMENGGLILSSEFDLDRTDYGMEEMADGVEKNVANKFFVGKPDREAEKKADEPQQKQYAATIDALVTLGRPIVLAHTAGEDAFPGSSLFAFGESVKAGVDMLDMNVVLTKDGVLIVQHDDTVDRVTNGTGAVADLTYAEIAVLDNAYWFTASCGVCRDQPETEYLYRGIRTGDKPSPEGYTADDFNIPTFRQLVKRFPNIPLNVEIKGKGAPAQAAADVLAVELAELGRSDATVVVSFDDAIVDYFHQIAPNVEVSAGRKVLTAYVLEGTRQPDGMRILQLPYESSGVQVITPELIARAKADGFPIWVWPNSRDLEKYDSYLSFLEQGIMGLNINFPAQAVQAVEDFASSR